MFDQIPVSLWNSLFLSFTAADLSFCKTFQDLGCTIRCHSREPHGTSVLTSRTRWHNRRRGCLFWTASCRARKRRWLQSYAVWFRSACGEEGAVYGAVIGDCYGGTEGWGAGCDRQNGGVGCEGRSAGFGTAIFQGVGKGEGGEAVDDG